jgi:diacylglycerol kinase (ATP)
MGGTVMQQDALTEDAQHKHTTTTAIMIANPTSGSYTQNKDQLDETLTFLRDHDWDVDLKLTQEAGDATKLAREAANQGTQVVIAVGGDGTINEVIQGLANSDTTLGILPLGTVNVWAREMEIPLDSTQAREILVSGETRRVDLGKVNDRYFLLMVGIGFDGEVAQAVEKKFLKRLGVVGYGLASIWIGLTYPSFVASIRLGDRWIRSRVLHIVIGNTQLYGGAVKFTWQAKCDDGLLDVCTIKRRNRFWRIVAMMDFLLHKEQRSRIVDYETCDDIEIRTRKPIAIQIDGDPAGTTPATFSVDTRALKVIVPQHIANALFSETTPTA